MRSSPPSSSYRRGRYLAIGLMLTDDVAEAITFPHADDAAVFAARFGCSAGPSMLVASKTIGPAA